MKSETFETTLRSFSHIVPFQPFTVELVSGTRITVDHPEAMIIRGGVAVYVSHTGAITILDHEGVSRISGLADTRSGQVA